MNVVSILLLCIVLAFLGLAALHRHHRPVADRCCAAGFATATLAAIAALTGSWQEFLSTLIVLTCLVAATMAMIAGLLGPELRHDVAAEWRSWRRDRHLLRAAGSIDAAAAARGCDITLPVDPSHPPTARPT